MAFRVIIPARYASSRLPGKVLLDIAGKPMIQHVYERALASGAQSVVIAADDARIKKVAEGFGACVCMTAPDHASGTERLAEAAVAMGYLDDDIIVNVQADEPLIPSDAISQVAEDLEKLPNTKIATLYKPIDSMADLFNPNKVKVVLNRRGYALYFSRAPLPWDRDRFTIPPDLSQSLQTTHWLHIGLYAYRAGFLQEYSQWEASPLESIEYLEQLRVLWHGGKTHLTLAKKDMPGDVNTMEDLEKIRKAIDS